MAVVIPACFENNFALEDGKPGDDLRVAFKFQSDVVKNLYKLDVVSGKLLFSFTETGVAYNEKENSSLVLEASLDLSKPGGCSVKLELEEKTVEKWGINFAGIVKVTHSTGKENEIFLPGTRTYDPAGLTGRSLCFLQCDIMLLCLCKGDPHASERIGPSCSRTQGAITLVGLVAAVKGANLEEINTLQEACHAAVARFVIIII